MDDDAALSTVRRWLETTLGGEVAALERQPRWRPVWFATVERDGATQELCVRGDRVDMDLTFPLAHEMRFQQLLHDHGLPVPAVHGWIDEPAAYVMDRVPGQFHFSGTDEADRRRVVDEYLQALAALHALPVGPFVDAGITRAATPEASGTVGLDRYIANYRAQQRHPDPFLEFALGWIARNPPRSCGREAPVVWDSGQFHHHDGHLLGRRPTDWFDGEAELDRFVRADAAEGRHDEALLVLFHRRNLRAQMLNGPAGSAMAAHIPIQRFGHACGTASPRLRSPGPSASRQPVRRRVGEWSELGYRSGTEEPPWQVRTRAAEPPRPQLRRHPKRSGRRRRTRSPSRARASSSQPLVRPSSQPQSTVSQTREHGPRHLTGSPSPRGRLGTSRGHTLQPS